jgi:integrase
MAGARLKQMPFRQWPVADRAAWQEAFRAGDVLDGCGPAAHWAPATRETNEQHYGRWLAFQSKTGQLHASARPEDRVTREALRDYIADQRKYLAPRTVVSSLVGLKVTMKAIAADRCWRWLEDICNALNRSSEPRNEKHARIRPTGEIYEAALRDLDRLLSTPLKRRIERVAFRDSLMIAMMAARPLRLKNFTALDIGGCLAREGTGWAIRIPGHEVKNRQPLEFPLPPSLLPYLEIYLARIRPSLCNAIASSALWLTFEGEPMQAHSIYYRFITRTTRLVGVRINPHLLRDCAATTMATDSPASALASAALLGHRNFATTERYYIRANRLEASRRLNALLAKVQR